MATGTVWFSLLAHVLFYNKCSASEFSLIACAGTYLEAGQQVPCSLGTVINITRVQYGVGAGNTTCTEFPNTTSCVRDLQADHEDHFSSWQHWCNGKIVCPGIDIPSLDIDCGTGAVKSNMMEIRYECVTLKQEIQVSRTCRGDIISDISCPYGFTVKILDMYFVDYAGRDTCDSSDTDYDCAILISDSDNHVRNHISDTCNGQASCDALNLYAIGVWNTSCATRESLVTDQLIVHYQCQTGSTCTHRCPGYTFNELVCPSTSVIHVSKLVYIAPAWVSHFTLQQCQGAEILSACDKIIQKHPILENCIGKRRCVPSATVLGIQILCPRKPAQAVYLCFQCYHIPGPPPRNTTSSSPVTPTQITEIITTITTDPQDIKSGTELYAYNIKSLVPVVAVIAAVLGCAVLVLIVVIIIVWRRQGMILANTKHEATALDAGDVNLNLTPETTSPGTSTEPAVVVVPRMVENSQDIMAPLSAISKKPDVAWVPRPADECPTYEVVNPQSVNTQPSEYLELADC